MRRLGFFFNVPIFVSAQAVIRLINVPFRRLPVLSSLPLFIRFNVER